MVLFYCKIQVSKHGSKKNRKKIYRNKSTGKMFIGSEIKTKALENSLINKLILEKIKQKIETIDCDINAKFTFHFPESEFYTVKKIRSQKILDISNAYQICEDAMEKAKVIKNDCLICSHNGSSRQPIPGDNYFLEIELTKI